MKTNHAKYYKHKTMSYIDRSNINDDLIREVKHIAEVIANENGTDLKTMCKTSRFADIILIRQIAHKICYDIVKAPLWVVGFVIGGKDHATVSHSIKVVNTYLDLASKIPCDVYKRSLEAVKANINIGIDSVFMHNIEYCPQLGSRYKEELYG